MQEEILQIATVPATLAMVNLIKSFGLASKFAPAVSILVGILFSILGSWSTGGTNISQVIITGIILGMSASGFYDASATKKRIQG